MAKPLENQPKVTMKIDLKDLTLKKPYSIDHIDSVPGTELVWRRRPFYAPPENLFSGGA